MIDWLCMDIGVTVFWFGSSTAYDDRFGVKKEC